MIEKIKDKINKVFERIAEIRERRKVLRQTAAAGRRAEERICKRK